MTASSDDNSMIQYVIVVRVIKVNSDTNPTQFCVYSQAKTNADNVRFSAKCVTINSQLVPEVFI